MKQRCLFAKIIFSVCAQRTWNAYNGECRPHALISVDFMKRTVNGFKETQVYLTNSAMKIISITKCCSNYRFQEDWQCLYRFSSLSELFISLFSVCLTDYKRVCATTQFSSRFNKNTYLAQKHLISSDIYQQIGHTTRQSKSSEGKWGESPMHFIWYKTVLIICICDARSPCEIAALWMWSHHICFSFYQSQCVHVCHPMIVYTA